jgi:hypothetical protein
LAVWLIFGVIVMLKLIDGPLLVSRKALMLTLVIACAAGLAYLALPYAWPESCYMRAAGMPSNDGVSVAIRVCKHRFDRYSLYD